MRRYLENLFEKPRWRGGPHICLAANLPAFETVRDAGRVAGSSEVSHIQETWKCSICGMIHADYIDANRREHYEGPAMLAAKRLRVLEVPE